ncbi:MAG: hypothetical protein HYX28_10380 [Candidatus Koribacter versatilis]|uniref:Uncharacterized protein n=1 Tax=Candidatus Korobacter versatilis TaxID=658062 RepID=A0A932A9L0_9BACT|nr:hypothetical protein [Candidatus Koribacter versatilis]
MLEHAHRNHEDAERKLRQKMRVYPTTPVGTHGAEAALAARQAERGNEPSAERRRMEDQQRKAIVSLYGEDLSSEDSIAAARPEKEGEEKAA